MLRMSVVGARELHKALGAKTREQKRALNTAIKVEGYRRLRQLRDEVRAGNPGGSPYIDQLSKIARRTKRGLMRKNQIPLYRLARLLRYTLIYDKGDIHLHFGFTSNPRRTLSASWKQLLQRHQEGIDVLYGKSRTELGIRFARIGGRLKKKNDPDAKFFFLRKTTGRKIDLPKRPIISPFWDANQAEAKRNIAVNFKRKMRGERI